MLFPWMVLAAAAVCAAAPAQQQQLEATQALEAMEAMKRPSDNQARRAVSAANNVFGIDLFQALRARGERGNAVASPLSVGAALALAQQGARGRTAQQLARALHLSDDCEEVAFGYNALFRALAQRTNENVLLSIANKVYAQRSFGVKEGFRQAATQSFGADAEEADFEGDAEGARAAINLWVAQATRGLIPELFSKGSITADTIMVLLNAIYFKGNWATPFDEKNTIDRPFHLSGTSQVNVPTMRDYIRADSTDLASLNASVLQLPYNDNATRLLIFMPDGADGLDQLENNIRQVNLQELNFQPNEMEVFLPKFKISTQMQLKETLKELGVRDFFDSKTADLTGISDKHGLYADKVIHQAVVEVTEKGTEAAAATGVQLVNKFVATYSVNRPFLFMLVDVDNTVLFIGRVTNPLGQ